MRSVSTISSLKLFSAGDFLCSLKATFFYSIEQTKHKYALYAYLRGSYPQLMQSARDQVAFAFWLGVRVMIHDREGVSLGFGAFGLH